MLARSPSHTLPNLEVVLFSVITILEDKAVSKDKVQIVKQIHNDRGVGHSKKNPGLFTDILQAMP